MQTARGTSIAEPVTSRRKATARGLFAGIAVTGLALDVVTKTLAVRYLDPADPPVLLGGLLTLQLIRNPGAAFSLGEQVTPVFTTLSILTLVFVVGFLLPRVAHRGWAVALGLLAAGVAGNLGDRLFRPPGPFFGHVVDFLQLPYWAIFNVADICVSSAAVLIVFWSIVRNTSLTGERYVTQSAHADAPRPPDAPDRDERDRDVPGPGEPDGGGRTGGSRPAA
jgi:signal peptidase II